MVDFSNVFMVGVSHFRTLQLRLVRRLREEHGAKVHMYCVLEQQRGFWQPALDEGVLASIRVDNLLYQTTDLAVDDPEAVIERARRLEAALGTTINRLAVSDRHLGRGYALAGFKHPRSVRSENASYLQMLNGFSAQLEFWRREFERERPTLVLCGGPLHAMIAKQFGVPYRTIAGSRYQDYHQWVHNEFFENPKVREAFDELDDTDLPGNVERPYELHMTLRTKFMRDVSLRRVCMRTGELIARNTYWRLRRYEKARGYYLGEEIRHIWRRRSHLAKLEGLTTPLAALEGQPFVYYPLHTEPETALQSLSPEYFYQHSCIAALSRDLPAGVKLAVKETYEAIGRRPTDFYAQLADFKNVVILDSMELGLEVVRQARAIATITGTGGFEAAVMGKPVISFGKHNHYNLLDHVYQMDDESQLPSVLVRCLADDAVNDSTRRDGARFLAATLKVSFDLSGFDHLNVDRVAESTVELAYNALCASFSEAHPVGSVQSAGFG
jgi:hypothetical protein